MNKPGQYDADKLKGEAEFYRLAIAMALLSIDEVVAWADEVITILDEPPIQIIDIALAGSKPKFDMMVLLAAVPGQGDLTHSAHRALGLLSTQFQLDQVTIDEAAEKLEAYYACAHVPHEESYKALAFFDVVNCYNLGYYGTFESITHESIKAEIQSFLDDYAV